jgi:hypothetical protein
LLHHKVIQQHTLLYPEVEAAAVQVTLEVVAAQEDI